MEFSRQDYCSGLPFSSPGDFPNEGIEHGSPVLQENSLPTEPPGEPLHYVPGTIIIMLRALPDFNWL